MPQRKKTIAKLVTDCWIEQNGQGECPSTTVGMLKALWPEVHDEAPYPVSLPMAVVNKQLAQDLSVDLSEVAESPQVATEDEVAERFSKKVHVDKPNRASSDLG